MTGGSRAWERSWAWPLAWSKGYGESRTRPTNGNERRYPRLRATREGRLGEERRATSDETFCSLLTRRSSPDRPSRVALHQIAPHASLVPDLSSALVPERPPAREDHRDAMLVRRRDHLGILHRSSRLHDGSYPCFGG